MQRGEAAARSSLLQLIRFPVLVCSRRHQAHSRMAQQDLDKMKPGLAFTNGSLTFCSSFYLDVFLHWLDPSGFGIN